MKIKLVYLLIILPLYLYCDALSLHEFLQRFHKNHPEISSLKVNFIQTKYSPMFLEPIQAAGTFYFMVQEEGHPLLRWEYSPPYEGWGLIKENYYYSYTKILDQLEVFSFEQYHHQQELLGALDFSEEKIARLIETKYALTIAEIEDDLRLQIQSTDIKPAFQKIFFYFTRKELQPNRLEYYEDPENFTRFRFQEMTVNPELASRIFEIQIPETTTIISEKEIQRMLE